jgi:hypothetical protein
MSLGSDSFFLALGTGDLVRRLKFQNPPVVSPGEFQTQLYFFVVPGRPLRNWIRTRSWDSSSIRTISNLAWERYFR